MNTTTRVTVFGDPPTYLFYKLPLLHFLIFQLVLILACFCVAGTDISCYAQQQRQSPQPQPDFRTPPAQPLGMSEPNAPTVLIAPNEDYRLSPGDIIDIRVEDAPELSRTVRVSAGGTFPLPFIGRVIAQQKTAEELASDIAEGLRGKYLVDPNVSVIVKQISSHSFFVQGAVRRPGVYQIEGRPSILKLITVAGGLAENFSSTAYVIREVKSPESAQSQATQLQAAGTSPAQPAAAGNQVVVAAVSPTPSQAAPADAPVTAATVSASLSPPPPTGSAQPATAELATEDAPTYELVKVNINGLLKGRFDQNMVLAPGSIVNIPPTDVFFVAGEVKAPGSFPLKDGTTLRQAISLAQGTTFEANKGKGVIFREDPNTGTRKDIEVDIGKVMSGKSDDVAIMANDIVIVPNSRLKAVGSVLLSAFGTSAVRMPGRF